MASSTLQADLERFVHEQLAFLIEEKGFHLRQIVKSRGYMTFQYIGGRIGLEMYIEFSDSTVIEGLLNVAERSAQPVDGAAAQGLRLKRPFFGALRNTLGVIDERIDQVSIAKRTPSPWSRDDFEKVIQLDSALVHDYIDALAQLPTELVFAPQASKNPG